MAFNSNFVKVSDDPVFKQVVVDTAPQDFVRIFWEHQPDFSDPLPYTYLVEVNEDYNLDSSWRQFAGPVVNQLGVEGPRIPFTGKVLRHGFRVRLTTPRGEYTSHVVSAQGIMTPRQWLFYKAITRRLTLAANNAVALKGVLLKRRWHGPRCACSDIETDEILDIACEQCFGTGIVGGYWVAFDGRLIDISPIVETVRRDPEQLRPPTDPQIVTGVMVGLPIINADDVWVRRDTKKRYYIRSVRVRSEIGGVPVYSLVEMGPADYGDIIYKFPIEGL